MQLQKKSKKISADAQNIQLSIQFDLDGFSFCITDIETKKVITYTTYTFDTTIASPELLLEKIMYIFANDQELHQEFSSVFVIHQNNLATLVPTELFDRNRLKPYLQFTIKTLPTDFITYDNLENMEAHNVYIPYVNINNFIFQNFGEFEYKHHSTVLIDKILEKTTQSITPRMYVNVATSFLDIIVIKNNQLQFYNSFNYTNKEDFIYYILFVAEQLQIAPEIFNLIFLGKIEKESALYTITYTYVKNIDFIESNTNFFTDKDEISNHSTYTLLS